MSSRWRAAGAAVLGLATAGLGYSIADDVILVQQCSRAALDAASERKELTDLVGLPLEAGPWYSTTLAVSHEGRSLSATFPVSGPTGSAIIHARTLRFKGSRSTLFYNLCEGGEWHLLALDAKVTSYAPQAQPGSQEKKQPEASWHGKSVQVDLMLPVGGLPLSSATGIPNSVCPPCEAQTQANVSAPSSK